VLKLFKNVPLIGNISGPSGAAVPGAAYASSPGPFQLLSQSWRSFLAEQGITDRDFFSQTVVSILSGFVARLIIFRFQGKNSIVEHWRGNSLIVLAAAAAGNVLWCGPILACSIIGVKLIYQ